jgi:hypothetical protein
MGESFAIKNVLRNAFDQPVQDTIGASPIFRRPRQDVLPCPPSEISIELVTEIAVKEVRPPARARLQAFWPGVDFTLAGVNETANSCASSVQQL